MHRNTTQKPDCLRVALLQLTATGTLDGNLRKGAAACCRAKELGADIALFPEMWSNGYHIPNDQEALLHDAISADSDFVRGFSALALDLEMAIAVTLLESHAPAPRNTLLLLDRFGNRVLTYAKVHTCDFDAECGLTRGESFPVVGLDTRLGSVQVGAMICYDREFPESARLLMLNGAELLLVPNACPMEVNRLSQLRARAFENMIGIATCNYAIGQPDCNGHSSACDGIAYWPGCDSSRDNMFFEAGGEEGVFVVDFPLAVMRRYRENEVHGNAYRRPEMYGPLVSDRTEYPFIRADRRQDAHE